MNLIFLKNYNNYFNRIIKYHDSLQPYLKDSDSFVTDKINFDVKDGVTTTQVVRVPEGADFVPDYALLVEPVENTYMILSRWFVMEWKKISGKQYQVLLRNDVVANYIKEISSAPIFVEKGNIQDINNPLIYNSEGMTFNEIKKKEVFLKDRTERGWLVGYFVQKLPDTETEKTFITKYSHVDRNVPATPISEISDKVVINFGSSNKPTYGSINKRTILTNEVYDMFLLTYNKANIANISHHTDTLTAFGHGIWYIPSNNFDGFMGLYKLFAKQKKDKIYDALFTSEYFPVDRETNKYIEELNQKLVQDSDGKLYYLKVTENNPATFTKRVSGGTQPDEYFVKFKTIIQSDITMRQFYDSRWEKEPYPLLETSVEVKQYTVQAVPAEIAELDISVTVKNTRNHLSDAPYDMFCIPFDINNHDLTRVIYGSTGDLDISNKLSLVMAKGLATEAGGTGTSKTYVYDIQYLPYCPIEEVKENTIFDLDGKLRITVDNESGFKEDKDYSIIYSGVGEAKEPVSIMFWATSRSGTFNIPFEYKDPESALELKLSNETEKLRICSPNYNGLFEFSPAKNRGVDYFNVDYTYRPFNPYIHINPNFKGLYGDDYNDNRGLIVGGDFSLETLTDAMTNYALSNKNYQQMFDREIQNMDVNNSINLKSDIISAVIGSIGAGIGGGVAGSMSGLPHAGVVGALAGGVGSAIGAGLDISFGQEAFRENRSFKNDMFGYQLGNIKALPRSLSKTTAFTYNHKVFPFVEFYDCTDVEKVALLNKLEYNGMTVMTIDTMKNYVSKGKEKHFFKGQVIRLDALSEDSHVANEIYNEIMKGVFF